jgi:hypothetical protein
MSELMREFDLITINPVMRHEQPARQPGIDLDFGIGKSRVRRQRGGGCSRSLFLHNRRSQQSGIR